MPKPGAATGFLCLGGGCGWRIFLASDLGLKYHPGCWADDAKFHSADSFISEAVLGKGGTCASLPVVYTAVGRRLGYPLMLAATRGHLYCRWDASPGGDCFNIEASGEGVSLFPNEHYRTGRFAMPPDTIKACGFPESFLPSEELAMFLCQLGECWVSEKSYREATTAFTWANELDPKRGQHAFLTNQTIREWKLKMPRRLPSRLFPKLELGLPAPYLKRMPRDLEREWIGLGVTERLLKNPELEQRWWEPMRRNPKLRNEV